MCAEAPERRLAAIMFTDIVGYTALMARDEEAARRARDRHQAVVRPLVEQRRGRLVEATGDESLSSFPSALDAVSAALAIQEALRDDAELSLRIGIHQGDVTFEGERVSGDGVNLAARIRPLAEPGGVCVSEEVQHSLRGQTDLAFAPLGERELKNVGRPIGVYAVTRGDGPASAGDDDFALPGMDERLVPGFGGAPAIAVLPFDNLSGDPEQEYFADGLAEDLITRLSTWRRLPVIARNSSFTYKGRAVDVKRVGAELGACYVVEGSVRRAGDRVRVSAQLIDATSGRHVWAETYDRQMRDIFELQDDLTQGIVASMGSALDESEYERVRRRPPGDLDAWEMVLRAGWYRSRASKEDNAIARDLLLRAVELDPNLAEGWAALSLTYIVDAIVPWTEAPRQAFAEAVRTARRAVAADARSAPAQAALGWALSLSAGEREGLPALELAVELDPSNGIARNMLGIFLSRAGRPEEGRANVEQAMRLSPRDPNMAGFLQGMAVAHFAAGEYEAAVEWGRRALQRGLNPVAHRFLAASLAHLGRLDEARAALEQVNEFGPDITLATVTELVARAPPDFRQRLLDGLRKAGLKE